MNTLLMSLMSLLKVSGTNASYDAAPPIAIIGIGLLIIIGIAVVLILVIVFAVRYLKRIRNKSSNTPQ